MTVAMPWGPPSRGQTLSPRDQAVINGVRRSVSDLMDRLTELDTYVTTLQTAVDDRHEGGRQVIKKEPTHQDHQMADEVLADRADQLGAAVQSLRAAVASLDERASHIETTATAADTRVSEVAKSNKRAVIAIVVLVVIVIVGGWLLRQNQQHIEEIRALQQQGISLRQDTLCPILQAALANDSPEARARFAQGPVAHDMFVARIKHGVDAMHCAPLTN